MTNHEFDAKVAKIVAAYGIDSRTACIADEACDDIERGSAAWFECFESAIENLMDGADE